MPIAPYECVGRTPVFETGRRGSSPRWGAELDLRSEAGERKGSIALHVRPQPVDVLGVCRIARDFAKVEDQVQFLARIFQGVEQMAQVVPT